MIEYESEYIEFLILGGLKENSAYSYRDYLKSVSKHLDMDLKRLTVFSNEDVTAILVRLTETGLAESYKNNCRTALKAYRRFLVQEQVEFSYPEEILNPTKFVEGAKKQIIVNSYERDRRVRNKAIEIHGLNCSVCDINFENVYGQIGIGFIHVHHLKPLHTVDETYEVDPEIDLVTVCPNCHAMIHRSNNPLSIEHLRDVMRKQKNI